VKCQRIILRRRDLLSINEPRRRISVSVSDGMSDLKMERLRLEDLELIRRLENS